MKKYVPLFVALGLIALAAVIYFAFFAGSSDDQTLSSSEVAISAPTQTSQAIDSPAPGDSNSGGSYVTYEEYSSNPGLYNDGEIVYFFNANWCPTCKLLNEDINKSQTDIPAEVAIISIDYDKYNDLKKQYGVTYQHTLVLVDQSGNQLKKWSGGNTLESVLQQI
jgi:thiol-disulfide isomerase/thioredoxin